jgi:hypothetical protein
MSLTLRRRNRQSSRRAYRAICVAYGATAQQPDCNAIRNLTGRRHDLSELGVTAQVVSSCS